MTYSRSVIRSPPTVDPPTVDPPTVDPPTVDPPTAPDRIAMRFAS
jgi:hypothetical protein